MTTLREIAEALHTKSVRDMATKIGLVAPISLLELITKLGLTVRKTKFESLKHGFHFTNSFDVDSTDLGIPGGKGKSKMGLCGGMCFGALVRFREGRSVPLTNKPPLNTGVESDLFWELFGRQTRTLLPSHWLQVLLWQADQKKQNLTLPGLWRGSLRVEFGNLDENINVLTLSQEWPKLKQTIDKGKPIILVLIRVKGLKADPSENHQVLAIGYRQLKLFSETIVDVYDPNVPDEVSQLKLSNFTELNAGKGKGGSPISNDFHGFFVIPEL